jgi:hypothetical protein
MLTDRKNKQILILSLLRECKKKENGEWLNVKINDFFTDRTH